MFKKVGEEIYLHYAEDVHFKVYSEQLYNWTLHLLKPFTKKFTDMSLFICWGIYADLESTYIKMISF